MKTVICGLWHVHAEGYYQTAAKYTDVVGVYEPNEVWRKSFCEKYNLKELLTEEDLINCGADAAIVCTSTDSHVDIIPKLAARKMNIFTEKVLALNSEECEIIEKAVRENGVEFVISLPKKYEAQTVTAKKIVDSSALGKINYFRFRNVHSGSIDCWLPAHFYSGKECGGGAMIDLGAHGMYLSDWFCGMPDEAKSVFTTACSLDPEKTGNTDRLEDNAATLFKYANGCIGLNETGFVSFGYPPILEIGGENGCIIVNGGSVSVRTRLDGELHEISLEPGKPYPIEQFCTGNILPGCGLEEAKRLTKLMEMAYAGA